MSGELDANGRPKRRALTSKEKLALIHVAVSSVDDTITPAEALSLIASVFGGHSPRRVLRDRLPDLLNLVTPTGRKKRS